MELSQVAMGIVVLAGLGGYYWWTTLRHGGVAGWQRHKLGLREGEELMAQYTAAFDYDETNLQKAANFAIGRETRGKFLYVGITNTDRLVIGHVEDSEPPMSFQRGQVTISHHADKAKIGRIAGTRGLEKAQVVAVTPMNQSQFRLQVAPSVAQALQSWANAPAN